MWSYTGVASKQIDRVLKWIGTHMPEWIGEREFAEMSAELGIGERPLRKLLRETGVRLSPMVEGVRQDSFENLGRTLIALQDEYEGADAGVARAIRRLVITAKDHARLASRRKPEKAEMVEWMLVWLENPPVFDSWCRLRPSARTPGNTDTEESSESM